VIVKSEDKMRVRLESMRYVLQQFDYDGRDPLIAVPPDPLILARVSDLRSFEER